MITLIPAQMTSKHFTVRTKQLSKDSRRRYAINFDLTIQQLRLYFDAEHLRKAYGQLARYAKEAWTQPLLLMCLTSGK